MLKSLKLLIFAVCLASCGPVESIQSEANGNAQTDSRPNIIIILADDLGYGDLGVFGSPSISTPHLDQLAEEGQKWTNFYVPDTVCTPSRGALMTGRLPVRIGLATAAPGPRSFRPESLSGLPDAEVTIAEMLQGAGYSTIALGKWHLGHRDGYLPTDQGFDQYFGIPYSNDMNKRPGKRFPERYFGEPDYLRWDIPLYRDSEEIERPVNQFTLTKRYTEEAVRFISQEHQKPFFLFLGYAMPHAPLFASNEFSGRSKRGLYGDAVEEIDWSVGQIKATLKTHGLENNTIIVFTSDNGPWLILRHMGGSAGPFRNGKGTAWEGGARVPAIFWGPNYISPGTQHGIGSTMDLFATFAGLAQQKLPEDRVYDSVDLAAAFRPDSESPRNFMPLYTRDQLYAIREGDFKLHLATLDRSGGLKPLDEPILFNLRMDPGEQYNVRAQHPEVYERLINMSSELSREIEIVPSEILKNAPLPD